MVTFVKEGRTYIQEFIFPLQLYLTFTTLFLTLKFCAFDIES